MKYCLRIVPLLMLLGGAGCVAFGPDAGPRDANLDLPARFAQTTADSGNAIAQDWWTDFGDEQLNGLVAAALSRNLDLVQADARLRQSAALARQQGAGRYPEVNVEGAVARAEAHSDTTDTATDTYSLGLAASYELDLWGRVRAARKGALLSAQAGVMDRDTVAMTVSAEVVQTYFQWLAQCAAVDVLEKQVALVDRQRELIELRFSRSQASALDVLEQREALAAAEAALLPERARVETLVNQLAVLSGQVPGSLSLTPGPLPELPPMSSAGLPADLLRVRPDVQAAWLRLQSAKWAVREAKANRLPTLRLTASAGYKAEELDLLFDQWVSNLAAGLIGPVIDGGRRRAAVAVQTALADERMAAYRKVVLTAVKEVQDALLNEQAQKHYFAAVGDQLLLTVQSCRAARYRYNNGQETYLRVLQAEARQRSLETQLINSHLQVLLYRVALCRAAGGAPERMILNEGESM